MIDQAGLMKSVVNEENVVKLGYNFDDTVWRPRYAIEAVRSCVDLAFHQHGFVMLYVTTCQENKAAIRLAEKLGM